MTVRILALVLAGAMVSSRSMAQSLPPDLAAERAAYRDWLLTSATSPFAVLAQRNIGTGVTLGPAEADVPLEGLEPGRVVERSGTVFFEQAGTARPLPRWRPVAFGKYRLMAGGLPGQSLLTVSTGSPRNPKPPAYYDFDPSLHRVVRLRPPPRQAEIRLLAPDGQVVVATEAGTVEIDAGGKRVPLTVRRIPVPGGEESELEIFFRDGTNDNGSYPAGRFVALIPVSGDQYRLDLNRARNPFCAYSSVFACPAPWRGNLIPGPVEAGEKYLGGGLSAPPVPEDR